MGRWSSAAVDRYTRLAPLEAALGGATSGLSEQARRDLIDELVAMGHARAVAEEATEEPKDDPVPQPASTPTAWVLNLSSGVHHVIRPGLEVAACGWKFSRAPHARLPGGTEPPPFPWAVCASCAPALHTSLKR